MILLLFHSKRSNSFRTIALGPSWTIKAWKIGRETSASMFFWPESLDFDDFWANAAQSRAVLLAISWSEDIFVIITRKRTWYLADFKTNRKTNCRPPEALNWQTHLPYRHFAQYPSSWLILEVPLALRHDLTLAVIKFLGDLCREPCRDSESLPGTSRPFNQNTLLLFWRTGFRIPCVAGSFRLELATMTKGKLFSFSMQLYSNKVGPPSTYSVSFSPVYHNHNTDDWLLLVRGKLPLTHRDTRNTCTERKAQGIPICAVIEQ